jgi:DNA-binding FadR family transcriptional regulator
MTNKGEAMDAGAPAARTDLYYWTRSGSHRPYKLSETVAREIVEDILANSLGEGDVLPPETAMLEQYRVGRASLREALRLIEVQGLITLKPGPGGGPVVGDIHAANLGRTASLYLRFAGATYRQLIEAMIIMDPWLAELAALRADHDQAKELLSTSIDEANSVRDDPEGIIRIAPGFHQAVYDLSGNPVLSTMTAAIDSVYIEQILRTIDLVPHQGAFLDDHQEIANAIVNSDAVLAKKLATEHMETIAACCYEQAGALLDRRIEWR